MKAQAQYNQSDLGVFNLYNKEAQRELEIFVEGQTLSFYVEPLSVGIKVDRALTFCRYLVSLNEKLTTLVGLLKRIAVSSCGENAIVLRAATLALFYSTAKYCAPVWSRSAHTRFIDMPINDALRIVTGCLCPTSTDNIFVIAGIQPTKLRHQNAKLFL